jgi:hypothetical protein
VPSSHHTASAVHDLEESEIERLAASPSGNSDAVFDEVISYDLTLSLPESSGQLRPIIRRVLGCRPKCFALDNRHVVSSASKKEQRIDEPLVEQGSERHHK